MATFWEPPALLPVASLVALTGAALYYGLRPALRAPLPVVTSEEDEVWGTDDPPPPPKRPYAYPLDRAAEVSAVEASAVEETPAAAEPAEPAEAPAPVAVSEDGSDDDEPSLADLFRPKRRRPPPDATPQD
ncbi:MAG TPA: hypothetical protein VFX49_10535 [Chloroflexota bacterium]|nr:hypothetical protein [Chloroflexota bacterium]